MTTHDDEPGWDTLAEEFGLEPGQSTAPPAKTEVPPTTKSGRVAAHHRPEPTPEPEDEGGDFGSGFEPEPAALPAALYDPGPDAEPEPEPTPEKADEGWRIPRPFSR